MEIAELDRFKSYLKEALVNPPGINAYESMMPEIRKRLSNLDVTKIEGARLSSVLILIYFDKGRIYLPLTKRHDYIGTHGGQISFPGGQHEVGDESRIFTALREANEEIGIDIDSIEVIGQLSEIYIPPSNFKVLPVVGIVNDKPTFVKEEYEVEHILEVEISEFINADNHKTKDITIRNGILRNTPYFDIQGHVVWGATAMILSELVYLIKNLDA